ncbi:hypothetical protein WR25_05509 [Diploscapter pachys]|uniref:Uncharacterized protein n=1 Tax=Diploscapter pachys TaxID=2018661 RepID=A0A2A2K5L2_9BILA|nr:hypothetical protein WR25_05509 [Diploscapter pachys]
MYPGVRRDDERGTERTGQPPHAASLKSLNCSRSAVFSSFPVAVCGRLSTNTTASGSHHFATAPFRCSTISRSLTSLPGLRTTTSSGPVRVDRIRLRAVIAFHHPRPADMQPPGAGAVARQMPPFVVDHRQFDAIGDAPLLGQHVELGILRPVVPVGRRRRGGRDGRGFGHAPQMLDVDAHAHQPRDHRARCGGPADRRHAQMARALAGRIGIGEHRQPHRWHARRYRHALLVHQPAQYFGVVDRGEDQLGSRHRRRERRAPGGGMEQRHHRQQHVGRRQSQHRRRRRQHRMQHGRAMLIQHALGVTRRPAGVAEHARVALRSGRPGIVVVFRGDQRGETIRTVAIHHHIMLDRRPLPAQPVDDRLERAIIEQHPVLGMVGDIDQLVVEQPWVDRMDHAAHADRAVPCDQVVRVVHRQRRDPVARAHAQPFQRPRQPPRIARDALPVGSRLAAVRPMRHDLARGMFARRMIEQCRYPEFEILHAAQHPWLLSVRAQPCASCRSGPYPRQERGQDGRCDEELPAAGTGTTYSLTERTAYRPLRHRYAAPPPPGGGGLGGAQFSGTTADRDDTRPVTVIADQPKGREGGKSSPARGRGTVRRQPNGGGGGHGTRP